MISNFLVLFATVFSKITIIILTILISRITETTKVIEIIGFTEIILITRITVITTITQIIIITTLIITLLRHKLVI